MSANVDKIIDNTIKHEGGWANHPDDRGGKTNFGITLKTFKSLEPGKTEQDLRNLTVDQAREFYRKHFFYGMAVDTLPKGIQDIIFDMNVNHGPRHTTRMLQRALVRLGEEVIVDGVLGPKTAGAAFRLPKDDLRDSLIICRLKFVTNFANRVPSQRKFLRTWVNRTLSFDNVEV